MGVGAGSSVATPAGSTIYFESSVREDEASSGKERKLPVVREIGRYQLQELLAQGGFASVWRGYDPVLRRDVAIKVPRTDKSVSPDIASDFLAEARRIADLNLAGVVPVYDLVEEDDGQILIVSKLMEGGTLATRMRRSRLDPRQACEWIATIAETLHAAHLKNVVHRDIKPANILLDAGGVPFVADFGLATTELEQRSESGGVVGTFSYMSPEQARGDAHLVDGRTDIYGLGMVLYEMLTGRVGFLGTSSAAVVEQILKREPRPLRSIDASIPPALERICLKCLAKNIPDRYTTASDLAADLRHWLRETSIPQTTLPETSTLPLAWRYAAIGILVVTILGTIIVVSGSGEQNAPSTAANSDDKDAVTNPPPPVAPPIAELSEFPPHPGEWTQVLRRPPKPLIWPLQKSRRSTEHDGEALLLKVKCDQLGLLELGETKQPDLAMQGVIEQAKWEGGVGFFFGYHIDNVAGPGVRRFQTATLETATNDGQVRLVICQSLYEVDGGGTTILMQRHIPITEAFLVPARPQNFEMSIEEMRLVVRWDEKRSFQVPAEVLRSFQPADFVGKFGLFVNRSEATFRNVNVKISDPKASAP